VVCEPVVERAADSFERRLFVDHVVDGAPDVKIVERRHGRLHR
jgi:hypothetical protein